MRKSLIALFTFGLISVGTVFYTGTIREVSASKASLSETTKELDRGEVFNLSVTNGSDKIKWKVNNKKVNLSCTKGQKVEVTAIKTGKSVVTAKVGNQTLKCNITVSENGLNITKKSLKSWQDFKLKLKGYDGEKIKWKVKGKNKTFKITDDNGKKWELKTKPVFCTSYTGENVEVQAQRSGKATVIAEVKGKKFKCTVTVKKRKGKRRDWRTLAKTAFTENGKFIDGSLVFTDKNYDIYDLDGYKTGRNIFDWI